MMDFYDVVFGARVKTERGEAGTVVHVYTGSLAAAVDVRHDDGRVSIERGHTLQAGGNDV